ncbi:hypothetical protein AB8A05_04300 [Tardiphaga sp. 538_B7_N1_4]|uniref:hypothetical protein n=1 Tax=Tardiphaga sp. 538_B7_N1_4 TaxID=3240778 RepID=UPI003F24A5FB
MTNPIATLIRLRNKHGAKSPIGSRCSTGVELLQNLNKPEFVDRAPLLRGSLAAALTEIQMLQAGGKPGVQVRRPSGLPAHQ